MENKRLYGKINFIGKQLARAHCQIEGVTPMRMHTLVYILKCTARGQKVCQKDVEREVNLRASSVSSLLQGLESDGYITRTISAGDARTKYIELTAKGIDICENGKRMMDECDEVVARALTEGEQEQLSAILDKIVDSIVNKD